MRGIGGGPKKLHSLLAREERGAMVSVRTIARILRRAGIAPRRRRRLDVTYPLHEAA